MKAKRIGQKQIERAEFVLGILVLFIGILGVFGFLPPNEPIVAILYGVFFGVMIARIIQRLLMPGAIKTIDVSRLEDPMISELDEASLEEAVGLLQAELEQRKTKTGT